jgi:flavin-dependent dehydrogenase
MDYDVTVVGARAAGAATAMLLARQGLRVLLVDRDRYGTDTLSTHALMRGSVFLLSRWGLLDKVVDAGTPPVRQTRFDYGAETMTVTIKPTLGVEALYAPRRTVLDALLVDAAAAAGAEVRFGVTVTGLLRDRYGRVVGVTARDRAGATLTARSPLTIGADGARSTVARKAGAGTVRAGTGPARSSTGTGRSWRSTGTSGSTGPGTAPGSSPPTPARCACSPASRPEHSRRAT